MPVLEDSSKCFGSNTIQCNISLHIALYTLRQSLRSLYSVKNSFISGDVKRRMHVELHLLSTACLKQKIPSQLWPVESADTPVITGKAAKTKNPPDARRDKKIMESVVIIIANDIKST